MKCMIAVILAGGKGTRLAEIAKDLPKPLVAIQGKPILQYQVENLKRSGINQVIMVIGYQGNKIKEFFGNGDRFGVRIDYFHEATPLGTAGAFYHLQDSLPDQFLVIYGDLIFDLNFEKFIHFHHKNHALCSLMVHPNDHPYDSDVFIMDSNKIIRKLLKKNLNRDFYYNNCVNAGIAILSKKALYNLQADVSQDLETDVVLPHISSGQVIGYKTSEYIRDMGTPERYHLVEEHVVKGIVAKRNTTYKQKAIFLDRDGTINKHVGFVSNPSDLKITEEAYWAIRLINRSEYLAIVITNQSVIARNLCSIKELEEIHRKMEVDLGQRHVYIDDLYYCPHHPDKGYPEENPLYKIQCHCRKPKIGLIEQAVEKYNIDLSQSYFIGDSLVDVQTGKNASLKTISLSSQRFSDIEPDYYAKDLLEAVEIVMDKGK